MFEKFVQLHIHSLHSRLDGIASPTEYVLRAKEIGHEYAAVTDHGHANGFFELNKSCIQNSIKPIFGIEMYVNDNLVAKDANEKRIRAKDAHLVLLAKNEVGYKNLLCLNYLSMKDNEHFYYSPRINTEEVFSRKEGLFVGSACINSPFGQLLRNGDITGAVKLVKKYKDILGDSFYIEIQLNEITYQMDSLKQGQKSYNDFMIKAANKFNIPIVVTGDVHYLSKGDDIVQTLSIAIRNKDTIDNLTFELESKNLYYHVMEDYLFFNKEFNYNYEERDIIQWCENSYEIAKQIDYFLPKRTRMLLPKFSSDDDALLIKNAKIGLTRKMKCDTIDEVPEEYKKRLYKELEVIIRKGFSGYCLIFEDIYNFAKKENIVVGSGRGSGGGCIILYALGVTSIDPIKYELLFERWISEARCSDVVYDYFKE